MKKLVCIIITLLSLTSCGTLNNNTKTPPIDPNSRWITGEVFQTLTTNCGLFSMDEGNYKTTTILLIDPTRIFYDDLQIRGYYKFVGTYKYTTRMDVSKTVPIYVHKDYLDTYRNYMPRY